MTIKRIVIILTLNLLFLLTLQASNTEFEEITIAGVDNPISFTLSPDGLTLLIVDKPKKGKLAIKQSKRPYLTSSWSVAQEITEINALIGEMTDISGFCFSHDGLSIFFAANFADSKGLKDIYRSDISNDIWQKPINLGAPINTQGDENFPSLSGNQQTLMFTRQITIKKLDKFATNELWMSDFSNKTQTWEEPLKLNVAINSGGISYPKILDDNRTIFYSKIDDDKSKWQIHWVKRWGDLHWYLPVSIDTLNSKESEICPVFCKADQYLYFMINTGDDNRPKCKLYRSQIPSNFYPDKTIWIRGKVTNKADQQPISARIELTEPVLGRIQYTTQTNAKNGQWQALVNAATPYILHVYNQNFTHTYQPIENTETNKDITLNHTLANSVQLQLNVYDIEDLTPLEASLEIRNSKGKKITATITKLNKSQQLIQLPIGDHYSLSASVPEYFTDSLKINLSDEILFDKFVRDIELKPIRRKLHLLVVDEETQAPIDATIDIMPTIKKQLIKPEHIIDKIGQYQVALREGLGYDIEVRGAQGYAFNHVEIDLKNDRKTNHLQIALKPLKRKVAIRLNNINFEFNSADLMESSFEELDRLIQLMNDNPEILVEIMAHTDDLGSDVYNEKLSTKRAASVADYLVINKINRDRLLPRGYGELVPLVPNTDDESRALNRRVEMKIIDKEDLIINSTKP